MNTTDVSGEVGYLSWLTCRFALWSSWCHYHSLSQAPSIMVQDLLRGVATGWTGVDMSTPLLSAVVPEIDANPVSFYSGGRRVGGQSWFGAWRMKQICCFRWVAKAKRVCFWGCCPWPLDHGLCPEPRTLAVCVHPTFFDLATPLDLLSAMRAWHRHTSRSGQAYTWRNRSPHRIINAWEPVEAVIHQTAPPAESLADDALNSLFFHVVVFIAYELNAIDFAKCSGEYWGDKWI